MKKMKLAKSTFFVDILIICVLIIGCGEKAPIEIDGQFSVKFVIADTSGFFPYDSDLGYAPIKGAEVMVQSIEYGTSHSSVTNAAGIVEFQNLVASLYKVMVFTTKINHSREYSFSAYTELELYKSNTPAETLFCQVVEQAAVVINEIYYCGPVNQSFYVSDQFVELYNRSDSTMYLDGMILARGTQVVNPEKEINDYAEALYCYRFPGKPGEQNYPIAPRGYVVVAQDAFDHTSVIQNSVDLSQSDWECYDQYGGDFDNFKVPNLINMRPDKPKDFFLNLTHGVVLLADGTRYSFQGNYVRLPLSTILDGVEYGSSASYQKLLTVRVDAGIAGNGIQSYSGKSIQRIGLAQDSNNSSQDFRVQLHPTPWY